MLEHTGVKQLTIGDCIGQCYMSDFSSTADTHRYTIRAVNSGVMAVLAKADIEGESKKNPEGLAKIT